MTGIEKVIALVGGQKALADLCGVKEPAVSKWVSKGYLPPKRWARASKVSGVAVDVIAADYMRVVTRGGR